MYPNIQRSFEYVRSSNQYPWDTISVEAILSEALYFLIWWQNTKYECINEICSPKRLFSASTSIARIWLFVEIKKQNQQETASNEIAAYIYRLEQIMHISKRYLEIPMNYLKWVDFKRLSGCGVNYIFRKW
jgi:hypothetical protein